MGRIDDLIRELEELRHPVSGVTSLRRGWWAEEQEPQRRIAQRFAPGTRRPPPEWRPPERGPTGRRLIPSEEREARYIAAVTTAGKFKGRAALAKLAQWNDEALFALEMTPRERDIVASRGKFSGKIMEALDWPHTELRKERRERKKIEDPLAMRKPGEVIFRHRAERAASIRRVFWEALKQARFRSSSRTTHATRIVKPGEEHVWTRGGTSEHEWYISSAVPRWDGRYLWLSPRVRVRQGPKTSLIMEKLREAQE